MIPILLILTVIGLAKLPQPYSKYVGIGLAVLMTFGMLYTAQAQEQTINLNHTYQNNSYDRLAESGVYELEDGTIAVVGTTISGFASRKGMRKRALKELKMWQEWNPDVKLKQINEKYRKMSIGVTPKITMIFKRIQ